MKTDIIECRKAIPIVGMVSSGKSTFLNSLLGIDVLEAKDNITTKFVCIIRYNPKLKVPKFYHVLLKLNRYSKDYDYYKDGKEAEGSKNIKEMICSINNKNKSNNTEPKYDDLFYILETDIKNIENKKFLSLYDFYDIPGLNEFIENQNNSHEENIDNKNKNAYKSKNNKEINNLPAPISIDSNIIKKSKIDEDIELPKENMRYIKGLFQFFKNKIDFGIILIDTEKYYKPQNLQIIKELHSSTQLNLKNFLFILNKIDKSTNREETIFNCKSFFINKLDSNIFNISLTTFVPIDSFQLKNELLFKYSFEYYFQYYFKVYCQEYVNIENEKKDEENISFIEFICEEMTKNIKDNRDKYLEDLSEKVSTNDFKYIVKIYETIKNSQNQDIEFGIDLDDEESYGTIGLKAFYVNFRDKIIIPEYSPNVKDLFNFFNNFLLPKENTIKTKINRIISDKEKAISQFKIIFEGLKKFENEDEDIIELLSLDLKRLEKIVYNQRRIYIPFIGVSNAGKSTILNCIAGYYIFPESEKECTTRGIIIKHSFDGNTSLFETDVDPSLDYYVFRERDCNPVAKGKNNVTEYLKSLNTIVSKNQQKHFFILRTPILLFDILQLPDELKERISFIDLPGGDTDENIMNQLSNEKDTTICQKLIHISSSFCFVNHGTAIKIDSNSNILNNLFHKLHMHSQIITTKDFLKNCLFIINEFDILTEEEKEISKIKNDIKRVLYLNQNDSNENYINAEIFNAKKYSNYLKIKNTYLI